MCQYENVFKNYEIFCFQLFFLYNFYSFSIAKYLFLIYVEVKFTIDKKLIIARLQKRTLSDKPYIVTLHESVINSLKNQIFVIHMKQTQTINDCLFSLFSMYILLNLICVKCSHVILYKKSYLVVHVIIHFWETSFFVQ